MAGAVFLGTIIGGLVLPQIPESPCPSVFQYISHTVPGDGTVIVTGLVTVHTPSLPDTSIHLYIHLQLQAILPSKYVGMVEVAERSDVVLKNKMTTVYRVRFPQARPLPTVLLISVNSQVICTGAPVNGPVVTDIRLEHSLRPLPQAAPTVPQEPGYNYTIDPGGECGRVVSANPLIAGGRPAERGQWPWLAAVFIIHPFGLEFHCSATVISRTFVMTVGHCMHHEEAGIMAPGDILAYLGKHYLRQWNEPNSVMKEVSAIHIHPEFDPGKYSADLALIQLSTLIQFNAFVQPACLWAQPTHLDLIVGRMASVAGWGKDHLGHKMSPIPRIIDIPIVSTQECVDSHAEFFFITSSTTLCAGGRNGVGPCNGDSGGGLMLAITENNVTRWHLRGIVSLSLLNSTTQSCDLNHFIVFTDTAKFLAWIASVVNANSPL